MQGNWPGRVAALSRWVTILCFVASGALLLLALPLNLIMAEVLLWIDDLGFWAPVAYALCYGIAATLFIPASALSLAAGVLFGLWLGTAVVWTGATIAIVLSFLLARHVARAKVEDLAASRPRFAAVDRAIGEQGWKIVALMRLSPLFPFNLQNYLFGVTAIGFWPSCLASAAFIIPGTFLYVYIGFAGGEAATAVGGAQGMDILDLGLKIVGLAATLVVTILVARIATKAIAKHVPPEETAEKAAAPPKEAAGGLSMRAIVILGLALACLAASAAAFAQRDAIRSRFIPPQQDVLERPAENALSSNESERPVNIQPLPNRLQS